MRVSCIDHRRYSAGGMVCPDSVPVSRVAGCSRRSAGRFTLRQGTKKIKNQESLQNLPCRGGNRRAGAHEKGNMGALLGSQDRKRDRKYVPGAKNP